MSDTNTAVNVDATGSAPEAGAVETPVVETPAGAVEGTAPENAETQAPEPAANEESDLLGEKGKKELIALRKRAQQAEAQLIYLQSQQATQPAAPAQPAGPPVKPVLANFETWEEYDVANEKYIIDMTKFTISQEQRQQIQMSQEQRLEHEWQERLTKESSEDPTILDIINDQTLPINNPTAQVIKASEFGPQILKYLDNNRIEAAKIATMNPLLMAKEIGRIEATIKATPKPAPPPRVSQAPAPVKPVNTIGTPVVDENNLSIEEWMERRNSQQYKKRSKE